MPSPEIRVGLISDTHGLLRPQALTELAGSDVIIHAGDIGRPEIVRRLVQIAPTFAVRGNIDEADWAAAYPSTQRVVVGQLNLFVLHDVAQLDLDPAKEGFAAVVFGHSHKPTIETRAGVLFFNPGSAGPRRFSLPVTVGRAYLSGLHIRPEIVHLPV
jgi:putative phosphoesterase